MGRIPTEASQQSFLEELSSKLNTCTIVDADPEPSNQTPSQGKGRKGVLRAVAAL